MGTEEQEYQSAVSYLSLLYDICLVRDRLKAIIGGLDANIPFPEVVEDQLERVSAFLLAKLEERGVYDGSFHAAAYVQDAKSSAQAPMVPGYHGDCPGCRECE